MRCLTARVTVLWEGAVSVECDGDSDDEVVMIVMMSDEEGSRSLLCSLKNSKGNS